MGILSIFLNFIIYLSIYLQHYELINIYCILHLLQSSITLFILFIKYVNLGVNSVGFCLLDISKYGKTYIFQIEEIADIF
jgi:hypothetical protein